MSMSDIWRIEYSRFLEKDIVHKTIWLSCLLFFISMFARDTYEPESEGVQKPIELRSFNELLHRISDQQYKIITNDLDRMSDESFFEMISEVIGKLGIDEQGLVSNLR